MAENFRNTAVITSVVKLQDDIVSMWLKDEEIAMASKPGQFVSFYCKDGSRLLPRPISICEINHSEGTLRFVFRLIGEGTKEIATYKVGDDVVIMGPLGNGFTLEGKKAILIGGGIGIPPMLELAKQLDIEKSIVLGYRDVTFMDKEFEPYGDVYVATEDGSTGIKGNVIDAIREHAIDADIIFACGPTPMLRGIKAYALEHGIKAQLSLEERMACGIGACLACVCKTKEVDHHTHVHNTRICKDGPVFYAQEVEL
ncbi:dihydroorotate dehydrogenase electron transfer subunit [Anaerosporobacter mobilis DSM 15930]|uniref:Dihydroorotate dehydrogenase B (NAD(+)), electron transfer subunit n=1 Tax=Anaerosporobacter mobilis DSM 15930 TaxID=1120996 RepID=A0A1M7F581_9FIRM|nr:dihydroorotate dehydrogenase electron transfer subunit [Anaerosporobacter mobilis]SHL99186.1 dihydroorotate dehydrogenase electron transfer subunit [Anaerosporobacter mobilis DSM 15930]